LVHTSRVQALTLLVLFLVLGLGVAHLFGLRYSRGDVYPRYSTLRADPLGTRVVLEALRRIDGLMVYRNTGPVAQLWGEPGTTLFVLGADPSMLEDGVVDEALEVEGLARHGLRAVVTVVPVTGPRLAPDDVLASEANRKKGGEAKDKPETPPLDEPPFPEAPRRVPLDRRLGFRLAYEPLPQDEDGEPRPDVARRRGSPPAGTDLPETLPWHSALFFADLADGWRVLYARNGHPVIIERDLGRGSLVLSGDTYVLSNESLSREPNAGLISWLLAENRTIVFDETHLGVAERPGVAALMRRYALHGFVAAVLLLVALFVWRVSAPFLPPHPEPGAVAEGVVSGRDAAAGLVTLLRRGIPRSEVLRVCREEWTRAFQKRRPELVSALEAWAGETADPVDAYRRISRRLQEMKVDYEH
jgi:hypothetical protein